MENKLFSSRISKIVLYKGEEQVTVDWFDINRVGVMEDSAYDKVFIRFHSGMESIEFNSIDPLYVNKIEVYKDVKWYEDNTEGVVIDTYIGCKSIRKELYSIGNYRYELISSLNGAERSIVETNTKEDIRSKLDLKTQRILGYFDNIERLNIKLGSDIKKATDGLIKNDTFTDVLRNIQSMRNNIMAINKSNDNIIDALSIK